MKKEDLKIIGTLATWDGRKENVYFGGSLIEDQEWTIDKTGAEVKYYEIIGESEDTLKLVTTNLAMTDDDGKIVIKLKY
jgi:predicted RNA-binding protein